MSVHTHTQTNTRIPYLIDGSLQETPSKFFGRFPRFAKSEHTPGRSHGFDHEVDVVAEWPNMATSVYWRERGWVCRTRSVRPSQSCFHYWSWNLAGSHPHTGLPDRHISTLHHPPLRLPLLVLFHNILLRPSDPGKDYFHRLTGWDSEHRLKGLHRGKEDQEKEKEKIIGHKWITNGFVRSPRHYIDLPF